LNSFDAFGLAEPITRALAQENYATPTPIQAQTIPVALRGRDVVGIAQTGTGKTAAFALPILHALAANRRARERKSGRVLVLSPTRELSGQILDSFNTYGRHLRVTTALAIGGVSIGGQVRALQDGVDVLVATPGRLLDLVQSHALRLDRVEVLVLDEADRMLDMGFLPAIQTITETIPPARQTLCFSATIEASVARVIETQVRNPVRVTIGSITKPVDRINLHFYEVEQDRKLGLLQHMLKEEQGSFLVFARTKHGADRLAKKLVNGSVAATRIHGDRTQSQRNQALQGFQEGYYRVMVATDVAARGIHVEGIAHVVNYDLPQAPEDFIHRVGRTGRAGAQGTASTFGTRSERAEIRNIERKLNIQLIRREVSSEVTREPQRTTAKIVPFPKQRGTFQFKGRRRAQGSR
jgi:ATP-dependent RNA helicase RhlE